MSKRMFQILDEINLADGENGTSHIAVCNTLLSVQTVKAGGHVTMGVPAEVVHKLLADKNCIPILLIVDKAEYLKQSTK